jgi:hypothetical protein
VGIIAVSLSLGVWAIGTITVGVHASGLLQAAGTKP